MSYSNYRLHVRVMVVCGIVFCDSAALDLCWS